MNDKCSYDDICTLLDRTTNTKCYRMLKAASINAEMGELKKLKNYIRKSTSDGSLQTVLPETNSVQPGTEQHYEVEK